MTGKPVVPRERAILDVQEAVDHYLTTAGVTTALGLITALHSTFGHIARHPASGSPRYAHELGLPEGSGPGCCDAIPISSSTSSVRA